MSAATEMFPYATHQELLIAAVLRSTGPVLELGTGHFSTAILHHLCMASKRPLASCDSDKGWMDRFRHLESGIHNFYYVPEDKWTEFDKIDLIQWGVVFVDQSPAESRAPVLQRLHAKGIGKPRYVVMHDSNADHVYHTDSIISQYKYHWHDTRHAVHTAVMSDVVPVDALLSSKEIHY